MAMYPFSAGRMAQPQMPNGGQSPMRPPSKPLNYGMQNQAPSAMARSKKMKPLQGAASRKLKGMQANATKGPSY